MHISPYKDLKIDYMQGILGEQCKCHNTASARCHGVVVTLTR